MQVIELAEAEVLDRLDVLHKTRRRTDAEVLQLAVQLPGLHDEHTLDPFSVGLDGREQAIRWRSPVLEPSAHAAVSAVVPMSVRF